MYCALLLAIAKSSFVLGDVQHDFLQFLTRHCVSTGGLGHLKGLLDLLVSYYSFNGTYNGSVVRVAILAARSYGQQQVKAPGYRHDVGNAEMPYH